jgi:transposase
MLEPLLPAEKEGGRHCGYALREVDNALEYLIRNGGAWRSLPQDLPHWQSVYHFGRNLSIVIVIGHGYSNR